jgi:hypothetical protein
MVEREYLVNLVSFAISALPVLAIAVLMLASFLELRRFRRRPSPSPARANESRVR